MRNALIVVGVGALVLAGGWWYLAQVNTTIVKNIQKESPAQNEGETSTPLQQGASIGEENLVEFRCAEGKTITAVFARDIVGLTLSDGRQMELRQDVSASGIRYVNAVETIEFRGEGDEGFLMEGGKTTFTNCRAQ